MKRGVKEINNNLKNENDFKIIYNISNNMKGGIEVVEQHKDTLSFTIRTTRTTERDLLYNNKEHSTYYNNNKTLMNKLINNNNQPTKQPTKQTTKKNRPAKYCGW